MARKFVRNITGTELTGKNVEPFDTNVQNDLLSDEQDVYVRQVRSNIIKDQYHCLTDNVKTIETDSDLMEIENYKKGDNQDKKNKSKINLNKATKNEAEKGTSNSHIMTPLQTKHAVKEHETPTEIKSLNDSLTVKKTSKNNFELDLNMSSGSDFEEILYILNNFEFRLNAIGNVDGTFDLKGDIINRSYNDNDIKKYFNKFTIYDSSYTNLRYVIFKSDNVKKENIVDITKNTNSLNGSIDLYIEFELNNGKTFSFNHTVLITNLPQ